MTGIFWYAQCLVFQVPKSPNSLEVWISNKVTSYNQNSKVQLACIMGISGGKGNWSCAQSKRNANTWDEATVWQFTKFNINMSTIGHFTVVSLVTWPWIVSEAGVDLVLIETSLLFICKSCCSYALLVFIYIRKTVRFL